MSKLHDKHSVADVTQVLQPMHYSQVKVTVLAKYPAKQVEEHDN